MKIYREHRHLEAEARWRNGALCLQRRKSSAGFWEQNGHSVRHGSIDRIGSLELSNDLLQFGNELAHEFTSVRMNLIEMERIIFEIERKKFVYLNVDENWSIAIPYSDHILVDLSSWVQELRTYLRLPWADSDVSPDTIVFSPRSFGYLLHECIGHRLESDDFTQVIQWSDSWQPLNFDVWDTKGESGWLGETLFDDLGVSGTDVKLLCGVTGSQKLLTQKTGNSRASSSDFHSLIRQRNLVVNVREEINPEPGSQLHIDDISTGSLISGEMRLMSNRQWFTDLDGRRFRIPPLSIRSSVEITRHMNAFGTSKTYHPGAGCAKSGQNQLPITFHTPFAWCRADSPVIQIEGY